MFVTMLAYKVSFKNNPEFFEKRKIKPLLNNKFPLDYNFDPYSGEKLYREEICFKINNVLLIDLAQRSKIVYDLDLLFDKDRYEFYIGKILTSELNVRYPFTANDLLYIWTNIQKILEMFSHRISENNFGIFNFEI